MAKSLTCFCNSTLPYNAAQKIARKPFSPGNTSNQVSRKPEKCVGGEEGWKGVVDKIAKKEKKKKGILGFEVPLG